MIRILVGLMVFILGMMSYILRVNFNIAVVTMTDMTNQTRFEECHNQSGYLR